MAKHFLIGLGNPGEEYEGTRHNTGRIVVDYILKKNGFPELVKSGKLNALMSQGEIEGETVVALEPETFMNKSGSSVALAVKSKKDAERTVVVYDDLDLPLGTWKISWNRGSGGHRGLESIIKALKTREFVRVRVGIAPTTPGGKLKKPAGEDKVLDFIIGPFKDKEMDEIKKIAKKVNEAVAMIVSEGKEKAMTGFN